MSEQELQKQLDEILELLRGPIRDAGNGGLAGMVRDLQRDMAEVKRVIGVLPCQGGEACPVQPMSRGKASAIIGGVMTLLAAVGAAGAWLAEWVGKLEWVTKVRGGQ